MHQASLLQLRLLDYDRSTYDFVGIAEEIFSSNHLGGLHQAPVRPWDQTPPALRRGQVQARIGCSVSKQERKGARRNAWDFEKSIAWKKFTRCYQRFILEWVAPQLGDDGGALLYQRKPILRVVLPGSMAPTALHCDAETRHRDQRANRAEDNLTYNASLVSLRTHCAVDLEIIQAAQLAALQVADRADRAMALRALCDRSARWPDASNTTKLRLLLGCPLSARPSLSCGIRPS